MADDLELAPREWEADVVLLDGRPARLRPIRPGDADRLVEFYGRVSDRSKYLRFFAPYPRLSAKDVERFTRVDHDRRVGLVVTLGGEIIGLGRYDALDDDEAEVAFLVEDMHQGRGLGQLLLEHLAQAARDRGLRRFVADVLPDNERMIQVFREQGYRTVGTLSDGVLRLEFPIEPTDTAIGVMLAREHRAEAASMRAFFDVRSVAVVGASRRHDTVGRALVRNLVLGDFTGTVHAVNPQAVAVSGLRAYASVQEIPDDVDLAVVAVPAAAVADVVLDCAAKGVRGLVVVSSGFAETGEAGRKRQRQLVGLARSYGLRLVGPNCLGVVNTASAVRINASLSPLMPTRGPVGVFCQSGAIGNAVLENVDRRGLGLSTFVSVGNRADVSGNDLLQYWEDDAATEVVLLHLESIGNPRKFARIARRVSRRKPVVAVMSGRMLQGEPLGRAGRDSGTAPRQALDAMFHQAGVIRVDRLDEMFDVAELLVRQPLPRGPRVAVVGDSQSVGLLVADAAATAGLIVQEQVAVGAGASAADFDKALQQVLGDPAVDAVVAVRIPPLRPIGTATKVPGAAAAPADKPVVLCSDAAPEAAVQALARVVSYARWLSRPAGEVRAYDDLRPSEARGLVEAALVAEPEGAELPGADVRRVLGAYGIDVWEQLPVDSEQAAVDAAAGLGWDVVLKGQAERLRVRTDLGFVWRTIDDEAEMRQAWASLTARLDEGSSGDFVVQKMAPGGVPVAVQAVEDPLFGPIVSFALAGAPSELLDDRAYRIPPVTDADAAAMVREIGSAPMLMGYRGAEPVDLAAIEELVQRVARLKHDLPRLVWLDLSLALATPDSVVVLDAFARVGPVGDTRTDWYVRRLARSPGDTLQG